MRKTIYRYLVCLTLLVLCSGCVSVMDRAGRALDGSAFAERRLARYRAADMELTIVQNRNRERSIIISMNAFPMIKLRGSMPNDNGVFFLTSLDYLAGNVHGWNEYSLQLIGEGRLVLGETASLEINDIEPLQITQGRIQRYDTRITGDNAITALRNRYERISVLTQWMLSQDGPKNQSIKDFEKHWKPVLFPEKVSGRHRPDNWRQDEDQFQRAEDIRWNTSYTERLFPEELHPVRNSGTLLRDWEEALSQIYMQYEWDSIKEKLSRQINLQIR